MHITDSWPYKCNLTLAMGPTCQSKNIMPVRWHDFSQECSQYFGFRERSLSLLSFAHEQWLPSFISGNGQTDRQTESNACEPSMHRWAQKWSIPHCIPYLHNTHIACFPPLRKGYGGESSGWENDKHVRLLYTQNAELQIVIGYSS